MIEIQQENNSILYGDRYADVKQKNRTRVKTIVLLALAFGCLTGS